MKISNETLIKFLNDIYSKPIITLLTNKEIKEIEDFYNKNYDKYSDIKGFYSSNKIVAKNIKK